MKGYIIPGDDTATGFHCKTVITSQIFKNNMKKE